MEGAPKWTNEQLELQSKRNIEDAKMTQEGAELVQDQDAEGKLLEPRLDAEKMGGIKILQQLDWGEISERKRREIAEKDIEKGDSIKVILEDGRELEGSYLDCDDQYFKIKLDEFYAGLLGRKGKEETWLEAGKVKDVLKNGDK